MNKSKVFYAVILLFFSGFLTASAQGLVQCSENGCTLCDLFSTLQRIVAEVLRFFIPTAAVVLMAFGGFKMVLAQGDPDAAKQARTIITAVIVGLVIVYGGWAAVNTFMVSMGFVDEHGLIKDTGRPWYQIPCSQAAPRQNIAVKGCGIFAPGA